MKLTGSQRRALRGQAHSLQPVVQVGQRGLTEDLIQELERALLAHELLKLRFVEWKEEKQAVLEELSARTGATVVGVVGHIAILYRPHPEPDQRKVTLS